MANPIRYYHVVLDNKNRSVTNCVPAVAPLSIPDATGTTSSFLSTKNSNVLLSLYKRVNSLNTRII